MDWVRQRGRWEVRDVEVTRWRWSSRSLGECADRGRKEGFKLWSEFGKERPSAAEDDDAAGRSGTGSQRGLWRRVRLSLLRPLQGAPPANLLQFLYTDAVTQSLSSLRRPSSHGRRAQAVQTRVAPEKQLLDFQLELDEAWALAGSSGVLKMPASNLYGVTLGQSTYCRSWRVRLLYVQKRGLS